MSETVLNNLRKSINSNSSPLKYVFISFILRLKTDGGRGTNYDEYLKGRKLKFINIILRFLYELIL